MKKVATKIWFNIKYFGIIGMLLKLIKIMFFWPFRLFDEMSLLIFRLRYGFFENLEKNKLYKLMKNKKYKYVFVFYPYTEWNLPVFQRPQQIALSLSKRNDVLYLFCTTNNYLDNISKLFKKKNENLYVVTDYSVIKDVDIPNKVVHFYSTDTISKYSEIQELLKNNDTVLYEYIDEIHESITGSFTDYYLEKHKKALKNEKIKVIVTADKLRDDLLKYRKKNYALSTNGVTIADFVPKTDEIDDRIVKLKKKYKKILCYYGSLACWFDYELLLKCSKKYPDYAFLLIGIEYDKSLKDSKILNQKNIIYLGKINYYELINITKDVDLLMIPFLVNEVTESTSPVKLFEYMATKKPILTTAMKECMKYKSVVIGKDHNDFINKIPSTLEKINDKKYIELEYQEALENTWDSKADIIVDLLDRKD